jgi:pyruvate dehydrogenase E1 component beta subunit
MERYFTGVPGLKVVAPSNAYDAKGLLKAALRDGNPVLMFEHKLLYGSKGARAEGGAVDGSSDIPAGDYLVPLDKAAVRRPGNDVTILSWLLMAHYAMQAAEQLSVGGHEGNGSHLPAVDAEVIDVRSLSPIDWETIGASVRKTGRAVIVEEGAITGGVGAEIAAGIAERWPHVRVVRVASPDVPVPFTPVLENAYRPDVARIVSAVQSLIQRQGLAA